MTPDLGGFVEAHVEPLNVIVPVPNGWLVTIEDRTDTLVIVPDDDQAGSDAAVADSVVINLRARPFSGGWPELRALAAHTLRELESSRLGYSLLDEASDPEDLRLRWTFRYDDPDVGPRTQVQGIVFDGELFVTTCTVAEADFPRFAKLFVAVVDGVRGEFD